jgi:hypothetical protein
MKVYKLEVIVIDFDRLGAHAIAETIVNANYPNDCIYPGVRRTSEAEIGDWSDDHPLNNAATRDEAVDALFGD